MSDEKKLTTTQPMGESKKILDSLSNFKRSTTTKSNSKSGIKLCNPPSADNSTSNFYDSNFTPNMTPNRTPNLSQNFIFNPFYQSTNSSNFYYMNDKLKSGNIKLISPSCSTNVTNAFLNNINFD